MSFESFIGNRKSTDRLRTKIREQRFPHGLIFAGPEGVGKHTFALAVAKALNCRIKGTMDFCGDCSSCRRIDSGSHPDVFQLTLQDEATQIKISQVRDMVGTLSLRPMEGTSKIYIVDPANLMNTEAANALLKGLEEPPDDSYFILIAVNVQELLLTIRSRCQVYHFSPLTFDEIRENGVVDELVVRWSQGSIGRARTLSTAAIEEQREMFLEFLEAAVNATDQTLRTLLAASAELSRGRQDFSSNLFVASILLADLIYLAEGVPDKIVNLDIRDRLQRVATSVTADRWLRVADFLRTIEGAVKGHVNRQMLTDVMALVATGALAGPEK